MKKNKFKKVVAILSMAGVMLTSISINNEKLVDASESRVNTETVPNPIKVITADDLRQMVADTLTPDMGYTVNSEIILENPFGSKALQKTMKEYEEWATADEIAWVNIGGKKTPVWNKGLTVSYWINVPSNEETGYNLSSVLRWELSGEESYWLNDYSKYLSCLRYHMDNDKYTAQQIEDSKKEESKILYGSPCYFKYLETRGFDEEGAPMPVLHEENGMSGPVYDSRYSLETQGMKRSVLFNFNPNYQWGYYRLADGEYEAIYEQEYYEKYNTLYMSENEIRQNLQIATGEVISAGAVYVDRKTGHRYSSDSIVAMADIYGEFQIDTDNSIMWLADDGTGKQKNPNIMESYGEVFNVQPGNSICMNSWQSNGGINEKNSYNLSEWPALSPITSLNISGDAVKYGNCNIWHQVTVSLQNDWIEFYVDGRCVHTNKNYGSFGSSYIATTNSSQFNKGYKDRWAGPLNRHPDLFVGSFVARLFMDWLTDEDATLHIGGVGKNADKYNLADSAMEFSIDEMRFYDQLLTEEQIVEAYEEQEGRLLNGENNPNQGIITPPGVSSEPVSPGPVTAEEVYLGDVNGDDKISLEDATKILRFSLLLGEPGNEKQKFLADVDENGEVQLADATKALRMALLLDEWKEVEYLVKLSDHKNNW